MFAAKLAYFNKKNPNSNGFGFLKKTIFILLLQYLVLEVAYRQL
jgi:hypothetical protein